MFKHNIFDTLSFVSIVVVYSKLLLTKEETEFVLMVDFFEIKLSKLGRFELIPIFKYKIGDKLISSRKFAEITGFSSTIVNNAFKTLTNEGVLKKNDRFFVIQSLSFDVEKIQQKIQFKK